MTEMRPTPSEMKNAIDLRRPATTIIPDYAESGVVCITGRRLCNWSRDRAPAAARLNYAASRSAIPLVTFATWMDFAIPSTLRILIRIQDGSNSYQARPCRAEVGC